MIHPSNKAFAQRVYARAEGHLARRGALGWLPPSLPECPGLPGRTSPRRGPEPHGSPREAEGAPGKVRASQGGPIGWGEKRPAESRARCSCAPPSCRKMWSTEARHLARMTEMPRLKALSRSGRTPDAPTFENVRDVCISRPPKALPGQPGRVSRTDPSKTDPPASPAGGVPGRSFSGSPRPRHGRRGLEAAQATIIAESCAKLSKKL